MVWELQYPILQVNTPFYTVFQSLFCSKWSKFEREKLLQNGTKWLDFLHRIFKGLPIGYPNGLGAPIPHFTSKQPIFTFFVSKLANLKRENSCKNDTKGVDHSHRLFKGPPNALIGYPNGLGAPIPHFTSRQPIFTSQQPIFTVLNAANSSGKNKREK